MAMLLITHDMGVIAGHARPGQRDVRGPDGRDGRDQEPVHGACAIRIRRRCSASIPRLNQDSTQRAVQHPRAAAGSGAAAAGLPVRAEVQPGHRQVPDARSRRWQARTRSHLFACWHPVDGPASAQAAAGRAAGGPPAAAGPAGPRRRRAGATGNAPARGARSGQGVPGHRGAILQRKVGQRARGVRRLVHRVARAKRSAWWASPAAARRPSGGWWWRWSARTRARCCSAARTFPPSAAASCDGSAATCS